MSKLHLVFGGRVKDPRTLDFADPKDLEVVGIFADYASAEKAWRSAAQRTVDDAEMKTVSYASSARTSALASSARSPEHPGPTAATSSLSQLCSAFRPLRVRSSSLQPTSVSLSNMWAYGSRSSRNPSDLSLIAAAMWWAWSHCSRPGNPPCEGLGVGEG